jgi:Uncharacterized conserved protein
MDAMLIVQVQVQVVVDGIAAFIAASRDNAAASRLEPGVIRFDVIQEAEDPSRFVLIEAYGDAQAAADHKLTVHYAAWRDAVAPLMAVPRSSVKYTDIDYPG